MWAILWLGAGGGGLPLRSAILIFLEFRAFKVEVIAHLRIKLTHHRLKSHFELHSYSAVTAKMSWQLNLIFFTMGSTL